LFGDDDFVFAAVRARRLDNPWTMQQKDGMRVLVNLSGLAPVVQRWLGRGVAYGGYAVKVSIAYAVKLSLVWKVQI
jgi:hypothetical protein